MKYVKYFTHLPDGGADHRRKTRYKEKPKRGSSYLCKYCKHWHVVAVSKPVCQFTPSGKLIKEFPSTNAAADETGVEKRNILENCRGHGHSAGGFVWKYKVTEGALDELNPGDRFIMDDALWLKVDMLEFGDFREFDGVVNLETGILRKILKTRMVTFTEEK